MIADGIVDTAIQGVIKQEEVTVEDYIEGICEEPLEEIRDRFMVYMAYLLENNYPFGPFNNMIHEEKLKSLLRFLETHQYVRPHYKNFNTTKVEGYWRKKSKKLLPKKIITKGKKTNILKKIFKKFF
jgi:hypothetical protein